MRILITDGLDALALEQLKTEFSWVKAIDIAQNQVADFINQNQVNILVVRSQTKVRAELLESCPSLKFVIRAGVGIDNIDTEVADKLGVKVFNTPLASSRAVAELVMAHIYTGMRYLHESNRDMPLDGDTQFNALKKSYAKAQEVQGKTLGIIGFGNIGKEVAKLAFLNGMKPVVHSRHASGDLELAIELSKEHKFKISIPNLSFEDLLAESDIVSIHREAAAEVLIGEEELNKMKKGAALINVSRASLVDEVALLEAIDAEHIMFAALDVFENEPQPSIHTLMHPALSLSPHIAGSTQESLARIGQEVVGIIQNLKANF